MIALAEELETGDGEEQQQEHDAGDRQGELGVHAADQGKTRKRDRDDGGEDEEGGHAVRDVILALERHQHQRGGQDVRDEVDRHGLPGAAAEEEEAGGAECDEDCPDSVDDAGRANGDDGKPGSSGCIAHVDDGDGKGDGDRHAGGRVGVPVEQGKRPGHEDDAGGGEDQGDPERGVAAECHDAMRGA